ncbi:hypothetical protein BH11ACT8_BH11ACT8_18490 [soil metagenome]
MVLLWLLPPVVVTLTAMLVVSWLGREGRGEVDREESLRRMGSVLDGEAPWWGRLLRRRRPVPGYAVAPQRRDHSSGVVVRRRPEPQAPVERAQPLPDDGSQRRAS